MKFDYSVYKKKYLKQSIKEVENELKKKIKYIDNGEYLQINDDDLSIQVADYYIYIYNEND